MPAGLFNDSLFDYAPTTLNPAALAAPVERLVQTTNAPAGVPASRDAESCTETVEEEAALQCRSTPPHPGFAIFSGMNSGPQPGRRPRRNRQPQQTQRHQPAVWQIVICKNPVPPSAQRATQQDLKAQRQHHPANADHQ